MRTVTRNFAFHITPRFIAATAGILVAFTLLTLSPLSAPSPLPFFPEDLSSHESTDSCNTTTYLPKALPRTSPDDNYHRDSRDVQSTILPS